VWNVYLVDRLPIEEATDGAYACMWPNRQRIYIRVDQKLARIYELLGHELLHALSGGSPQTRGQRGAEEDFVERCETHFWRLAAQFGAQPPALPAGYQAFRRACRKAAA